MNKCVKFTRISFLTELSACDSVDNELRRLSAHTNDPILKAAGIEEECILLLSVDDADEFIKCLLEAFYTTNFENGKIIYDGAKINADDEEIVQVIANSGSPYYKDSVGTILDRINKQRINYEYIKEHFKDNRISHIINEKHFECYNKKYAK